MSSKPKLIIIVGPTASGKSEFAVRLAKKINGEIISADSRQVYQGLAIGTGKISQEDRRGIPHHLLDVVSPKKQFTVVDFKKLSKDVIANLTRRKKITLVVGGTGFWIDALVYDIDFPGVAPNFKLRRALSKKSAGELFRMLQRLDKERAKTIESKNPRRLIRALEIARALGKTPLLKKHSPYDVFWLGLNPPRTVLQKRIEKRVKKMLKNGLLREVKKLLRRGVSKKRIREFGFEYRLSLDALERKITLPRLHYRLVQETLDYARRQISWFRKNPRIYWIRSPSQRKGRKITSTLFRFLTSSSQRAKS